VGYSNTFLLGSLFLLCFWRSCLGPHGFDLNLASNGLALLNSGGNVSYASIDGEWWRLLTCVFLHGGLIHLLFNMAALKQIGPEIESVFGRGRMLFFFVMTGIIASFGSSLDGSPAVRIGASGAIMGMIGVAGGWGQRLGSRHGLSVRNQMLRWAMYTIIYGYALGADNVAHAVGLMAGVVIGFLSPAQPERVRQTVGDWLITACATILIFGAVAIILVRPACLSPMWSHDILSDYEDGNDEQSVF
jgi:rhomboid protease GluP